MHHSESDETQSRAAQALLDREYGKPAAQYNLTCHEGGPLGADFLRNLSHEELEVRIMRLWRWPRSRTRRRTALMAVDPRAVDAVLDGVAIAMAETIVSDPRKAEILEGMSLETLQLLAKRLSDLAGVEYPPKGEG
jgi:hypothetical protein